MIRTVNEEKCFTCQTITNAYDQMRGRLCPSCAGVSEPLIDHSEDIEVSASSYHISNAVWEQWLETSRLTLAKPYLNKKTKEQLLLDVQNLLYKVALASAKVFASKEKQPTFTLPNNGARKDCSHYPECISRLDWKTNIHRRGLSLKSCPHECEFHVNSYTVWAFEEKHAKS